MQKPSLPHLLAVLTAFSACLSQAENADFTHDTTMKKATEIFTPQPIPVNPRFKNLTGQKFGRLTVVEYVGKYKCGATLWQCSCECGQTRVAAAVNLVKGSTKSCGCFRREISRASSTHHMCDTTEYASWVGLRSRCNSPSNPKFHRYGGRGITLCSEWESFETFFADMGPRPSPEHSLDRINNSLGYCKENCRWATPAEQSNNRECTVFITFNGEKNPLTYWAVETGISRHVLLQRVKKLGWSAERALTTPVKGGSKA